MGRRKNVAAPGAEAEGMETFALPPAGMRATYQADQPAEGKKIMTRLIDSLQSGVPAGLDELRSLGQTMKRRRDDILAFFDRVC